MEPRIQYAKTSDGVSIAYWTLGEGAPFVHLPSVPFSPALRLWHTSGGRRWCESLAEKRRFVRYDDRGFGHSDRYGKGSGDANDRRAQREQEREQGLVAFACKLHGDLVRELHAAAQAKGVGLNEITAELLRKGLDKK